MQVLPVLRIGHMDDATAQPAEQVDPLLAIGQALVLLRDDGMIEHLLTAIEVESMPAEIGLALRIVPGDHFCTM